MGVDKNGFAPKTNGTGESPNNTTSGAVDTGESENAGGVSVTAAENDSSPVENGGPEPIDKSIVAAAEKEMAGSARSAIMSAAESEPIPVGRGIW